MNAADAGPRPGNPVFRLSDELVERFADGSPTTATFVGVRGHDHRWDDFSPAGASERAYLLRDFRQRLLDLGPLSNRWEALARQVIVDTCDEKLTAHAAGDHFHDLNSIQSTFQVMRLVFDCMDTGTVEGWRAIVSRLSGLEAACRGYRTLLDAGMQSQQVVSRRQVLAAVKQGRHLAGSDAFFDGLLKQLDAKPQQDSTLRPALVAGVEAAKQTLAHFCDYLEQQYLPKAPDRDAVGEERYGRAALQHLGLKLDARETYAWGWDEVRQIESRMQEIARGLFPGCTVPEAIERIERNPELRVVGADAFVDRMLERQLTALSQLDGRHFAVPPPARKIEVKIAPPGGALGAYYLAPSEDFSRPGTVWYSVGSETEFPLFTQISTAYHEGFPGHHLQCSMQVYLADRLSRFQRLIAMNTGHCEGWALYAEHLMNELGYLERPEYVLGMLAQQLMRAYRVVVDIGLHLELPIPADAPFHPGEAWSYDLAVEAMEKRAFLSRDLAESEVCRYLGWPGQAIAYKVGQRVLLEVREELARRQGPQFDLKAFHGSVLELGPVGLDLLRKRLLA